MRQLAEKMDMPHSFIGKLECNQRRLDVGELVAYCEVLELDPHEGLKVAIAAHQIA